MPESLISKADLRSVVTLVMIATFIGSWIYFLSVVPIDASKPVDGTIMLMLMMNLLIGTLVGVFAWLGFKQGQTQPQPGS